MRPQPQNQLRDFSSSCAEMERRNCEGYNNPMYIRHYEMTMKLEGARARKQQRVVKAKETKTVEHSDGVKRRAGRK